MKEYSGVLKNLGGATVASDKLRGSDQMITSYSYIQIGDQMIKKVSVQTGIDQELGRAQGQEITVYMKGKYLLGIKLSDGRTFASEWGGVFLSGLHFLLMLPLAIIFSLILIGLPLLMVVWLLWERFLAAMAAKDIPNAIMI